MELNCIATGVLLVGAPPSWNTGMFGFDPTIIRNGPGDYEVDLAPGNAFDNTRAVCATCLGYQFIGGDQISVAIRDTIPGQRLRVTTLQEQPAPAPSALADCAVVILSIYALPATS